MKRGQIKGFYLIISLILGMSLDSIAAPSLVQVWHAEGLKTPESVLLYREGKKTFLLVSQIDGDPSTVDWQGGIAKLSLNGEVDNLDWIVGLNAPKGMAYQGDTLYVADIDTVVVISIKSGTVVKRIPVPGAKFLNDVTVDTKGAIYVTDTQTQKVHKLHNGVVEEYVSKLAAPNGIKSIGSNLVVGSGKQLLLLDGQKNQLPVAVGFAQDIDGIEPIGKGNFIVSCWAGLLYFVQVDGKIELLVDSQLEKINTADIGYDSETKLLFVPNFFKDSVTAYKVVE